MLETKEEKLARTRKWANMFLGGKVNLYTKFQTPPQFNAITSLKMITKIQLVHFLPETNEEKLDQTRPKVGEYVSGRQSELRGKT